MPFSSIPISDIEPPTPSPLFPSKLSDLLTLSPSVARKLVLDYGLVGPEDDSYADSPTDPKMPATPIDADIINENRDKDLNKFMAHIGVSPQTSKFELTAVLILFFFLGLLGSLSNRPRIVISSISHAFDHESLEVEFRMRLYFDVDNEGSE